MEFRLFGGVQLECAGQLLDVGSPRQQAVLAALAVDVGRPVAIETLIDRVWGDTPPVEARNVLYSHLSRIRQLLRHATGLSDAVARIDRRSAGYVLDVDPDAVDLRRFTRLAEQGTNLRNADEDRASALTEALILWRGSPLAGISGDWADQIRGSWHRRRLDAAVQWGELELKLGRANGVISIVPDLIVEYPLAEPLEGLLMRALHTAGRDAEAIERYAVIRDRLADELGTDPGPELRALHAAILRGELLAPDRDGSPGMEPVLPPPVPRQLPAHTSRFAGRAAELDQLTTFLDESTHDRGGTVVITAIDGTAGVGKTALALHWAHRVAERFPDGQLYVNLRGFDPTNTPVSSAEALRGFLHALGVPSEGIPTTLDAQAGLYRSLAADRRLLVVLDNARDAEQVRSLLPASPACLVVVTSRNQLADLSVREGARTLTLDLLTPREARALLTRHLGHDRVRAEPDAVTELIEHCSRLPLALAIVAARANTHPGLSLRVLAKELSDVPTRLAGLDTGEATTSMRAVFSWSYNHLSAPAARMFRLFGLHPGPDIALPAAARLADLDLAQAREALGELIRARLLTQYVPGRYTCHDLLRAYAVSLAATYDPQDDQGRALVRVFNHYLHTTAAALHILHPHDEHSPHIAASATTTSSVTDLTTAEAWFDIERANLTTTIAHSAAYGWHAYVHRLANMLLVRYAELGDAYPGRIYAHALQAAQYTGDQATEAFALTYIGINQWVQGCYQQATDHLRQAIVIARDTGNCVGEVLALNYLGLVQWRQGQYPAATENYRRALTISRDNDIRVGEATALNHLGLIHWQQCQYERATERFQHAVAIARAIGFQLGEAFALNNVGAVHCGQGRYGLATEHHQQALTIAREIIDRNIEAVALNNVGVVHCRQGRYGQATEHHQQALTICREIGFRLGEALARDDLGVALCRQGRYGQATEHHEQAIAICHEINDRASEPRMLNHLAEANQADGHLDQARTHHTAALTLATELGDLYEQARAYHGLARHHHATGNHTQTRRYLLQALALYADLDVPDADAARAHLTALDQP
ncbi:MAG TPA: tetratricopeptide repeat protein [Actinophytocola sp.]|uniref:AfsR/SARP family transcriptional regulator n=1 Tax=Actinophytocola sp. TaxID=1872138 RepID=UPI002DDCC313|nr:tetratricopeptide repeat protein [Actinophytocola sp.]HEV2784568.1 tetratricopeptide repeat protein [Actinophytocola sp.]